MLGALYHGIIAASDQIAATGTFKVKSGTYTGTAGILPITGVGFQPKLIIIKSSASAASDDPLIMWSGMSDNTGAGPAAAVISPSTAPATGIINSYDSDGFTLAINALANTLLATYYYVCIGGSSSTDCASGSYMGNSVDGATPISGLTFAPSVVFIRRRNLTSNFVVFRQTSMAADSAFLLGNASSFNANIVQAMNATSIEVGTSSNVNTTSVNYDWFAFTAPAANGAFGSYVGSGVDNSNLVSGLTFQPDFVFIKGNTTQESVMRGTANVGDDSSILSNSTANSANRIQAINSDGFQLGTNAAVNSAGTTYHYFALKST